jgi:hypothetical protein
MVGGDRTDEGELVTWGGWNLSYNLFSRVSITFCFLININFNLIKLV